MMPEGPAGPLLRLLGAAGVGLVERVDRVVLQPNVSLGIRRASRCGCDDAVGGGSEVRRVPAPMPPLAFQRRRVAAETVPAPSPVGGSVLNRVSSGAPCDAGSPRQWGRLPAWDGGAGESTTNLATVTGVEGMAKSSVFDALNAAICSRTEENAAAVCLQSAFRMHRLRKRYVMMRRAAIVLQKVVRRSQVQRGVMRRMRVAAREEHLRGVFDYFATRIQAVFRGVVSRRHHHDFYATKRYLLRVAQKSDAVCAEANRIAADQLLQLQAAEREHQQAQYLKAASKLRHMVSTATSSGVFQRPVHGRGHRQGWAGTEDSDGTLSHTAAASTDPALGGSEHVGCQRNTACSAKGSATLGTALSTTIFGSHVEADILYSAALEQPFAKSTKTKQVGGRAAGAAQTHPAAPHAPREKPPGRGVRHQQLATSAPTGRVSGEQTGDAGGPAASGQRSPGLARSDAGRPCRDGAAGKKARDANLAPPGVAGPVHGTGRPKRLLPYIESSPHAVQSHSPYDAERDIENLRRAVGHRLMSSLHHGRPFRIGG